MPVATTSSENPLFHPSPDRLIAGGKFFRAVGSGEPRFLKAVTFGPFADSPSLDRQRGDLQRIRSDLGANAVRLYEIPERELLDALADAGLVAFLGPPWNFDVDFLEERRHLREAHRQISGTVSALRGHPAVAGYFIGNEIQSPLVRWMGPAQVRRELERLIATGKEADPGALFSYPSYPSTEYLLPRNQDFVSYNVYLEDRENFARYLRRLQNLAGNKPLLVSEFGIDSRTHGEETQAEVLEWMTEEACRAGLAGVTVFGWSDQWRRTGEPVEDWDFGLVRRDGSEKASLARLGKMWKRISGPADGLGRLEKPPRVSVIVCTHRGGRTLENCLRSLEALRYENFEAIVVNDGADAAVTEIVAAFPAVRLIETAHGGLSAARNRGASVAGGEILAYTDDDCEADPDWLRWLTAEFAEGGEDLGAVGGPNVPPPPESFWQACVEASPGGPAHVLIGDRVAEHIPGCNLAIRRSAFAAVGGFDERFWAAGDDVDFCWRLRSSGYRIGFHPGAMVWHHRRFTLGAYLRQQIGYGKAEALLVPLHPERVGSIGGARWEGCVYGSAQIFVPDAFTRIYQGVFGYAPYQFLYGGGVSGLGHVAGSFPWGLLAVAGVGLVFLLPPAGVLGAGMLTLTFWQAWRTARQTVIDTRFDGGCARFWVGLMALAQPFLRSYYRFSGSLPHVRWPRELPVRTAPVYLPRFRWLRWRRRFRFWSEEKVDRVAWLKTLWQQCADEKLPVSAGTGWESWDLEWTPGSWWAIHLTTVTEYHGTGNRLNKARLEARPTVLTTSWRILVIGLWFLGETAAWFPWDGWSSLIAGMMVLLPELAAIRLLRRFAGLLRRSAKDAGLIEVSRNC